jgi:hypothetical protein
MASYRFFVFQPNGKIGAIPTVQCQIESKAIKTDVCICFSLNGITGEGRKFFYFDCIAI